MNIFDFTISLLAPHCCLACGREGQLLCGWCVSELLLAPTERCYACQKPSPDYQVCLACRQQTPLGHVWVGADYKGAAKQLVKQFKFQGVRSAAKPLANQLQSVLPFLTDVVVVPIPTATGRVRQRGYDHTLLLAKQVAELKGWPMNKLLSRRGQTRQVGTKRQQRMQQLAGAYYVKHSRKVQGRHILLIDDVITTGATLTEAARILKQAGAQTVDAAVFAQKQ